jgi:hypothetical protein
MPALPIAGSLAALLSLLAPAFTAPSFETFCCLAVGFLARVGEHTVTGMLQAARRERRWHHSRAHEFFSRARWCPDRLGLLLLDFLVATLVPAGAPLRLAVDDSLFGRTGRKVYGAAYHYDATAAAGAGGRQLGFGNNWVVLALVVRLPCGRRAFGLPVLFRLWLPAPRVKSRRAGGAASRRRPDPAYPSKPELARRLVDLVAARYPERALELLGDAAYATGALAGLPARATVTSRLKANAALYGPQPPPTGKRGRPALKGKRLPALKQIADDPTTAWEQTTVSRGGKTETVCWHSFACLWYGVFGGQPVRIVLVRTPKRTDGYDIALVSTDLRASAQQLIERYDERWSIELCFQDAKQLTGVGEARNRTRKAVERTVPFGFLCQTLVIAWYALHGKADADVHQRRLSAPWYQQKRSPSYQDMLVSLRRELIIAQYRTVTDRAPTATQISQPAHPLKTTAA